MHGATNGGFGVTPRAAFGWRGALPGVGEALKREIAGLGLVEQRYLWGFDGCGCFGFALSRACLGAFRGDLSGRFAFLHAAAFAVVGGALGCCAGAIVSMMISWPPQHGQGIASTRGGSSVSPRLSLLA